MFSLLCLDTFDLIEIKTIDGLATNENNTYLTMGAHAIKDHREKDVLAITDGNGLKATDVIRDNTPPEISGFEFDMNTGIISITFTDTIQLTGFNVTEITLQSSSNISQSNISYTLQGGSVQRSTKAAAVLEISVRPEDLNEIKKNEYLATNKSNTWLSVTSKVAKDAASNQLLEISEYGAFQADDFTDDANNPYLESFIFNLNTGELTLTFNETIDVTTYVPFGITFQNDRDNELSTDFYTLTGGMIIGGDGPIFKIQLSKDDLNSLKSKPDLATKKATTFITLQEFAFTDMRNNKVINVTSDSPIQAETVPPDVIPPVLLDFIVDMNQGLLNLTFTEYVDPETYKYSEVQLQNQHNNSYQTVELTGGIVESNLDVFTIKLNNEDLFNIQRYVNLSTDINNTFLSFSDGFIKDASGKNVEEIKSTSAKKATNFTADTTPPVLQNFTLNLDTKELLLTFDEVVNVESFNISHFILQDTSFDSNSSITLMTSTVQDDNDHIVVIDISKDDKEKIDTTYDLATGKPDTFLKITGDGLSDMVDNQIEDSDALNVFQYIEDSSGPVVASFILNIQEGLLELTFNEAIVPSTFNVSNIKISVSPTPKDIAVFSYTLEYTSKPTGKDRSILNLTLANQDLNYIKSEPLFSSNSSYVFITYETNTIEDVYGNVGPAVTSKLLSADDVILDITGPKLKEFDLNMNSNTLTLSFSETINIAEFDVSQITIQSNYSDPEYFVTLSSKNTTFELSNYVDVVVQLSRSDANKIKAIQELAFDNTSTFISITDRLVEDISDNQNFPVEGKAVQNYVRDTSPLEFLRFTINMTSQILMLYFEEPVDIATFDYSDIVLFNPQNTSTVFMISYSDLVEVNTADVTIQLIQDDTNILNSLPICTKASDCYLNFTLGLSNDTAGNPITVPKLQIQVDNFYGDDISPSLVEFKEFNLEEGLVTLLFSETVDVDTIDFTKLNFTEWYNDPNVIINLTGGEIVEHDGPLITFRLTNSDLNRLKLNKATICNDEQNCWIRFSSEFIKDTFNNSVTPVLDSATFLENEYAASFIDDEKPPYIVSYSLDMNSTILSLTFDEIVNIDKLNLKEAQFQDGPNATSLVQLTDNGNLLTTGLAQVVTLELNADDVYNLKADLFVATNISSTWIVFTEMFIEDVSNVQIEPAIDEISAIQADNYTADQIKPTVVEFKELSLRDNTFTVVFSEPILAETYVPSKFIIQSNENGNQYYRVLTGGEPDLSEVTDTLVVTFTKEDVSEIEKEVMLAFDQSNTFINISNGAVTDTAGNPVVGTKDNDNNPIAIQVQNHLKDITGPELIDFSLDMDSGLVVLTFDDVVNPATFMPTEITFLASAEDDEDILHRLEEGETSSPIGFTVNFTLVANDLNALKRFDQLATNRNNTFVSITSLVILEPGNVGALPLTVQCGNYTPDTTSPKLVSFVYDAHIASLSLLFSETVNISSLDPSGITLLNAKTESQATQQHTLTGGVAVPNDTDITFDLYLTVYDLHIIQENTKLATVTNNSFLSILNTTVYDMAGNPVENLPLTDAKGAIDHNKDMLSPSLLYFTFDLNEGILALTFSEAVNASSVNVSSFVLSNKVDVDDENFQYHRLTSGLASVNDTTVSDHDVTLLLYISEYDLNEIKKLMDLATDKTNTRLYYDADAVKDAAGNGLEGRTVSKALFASDFTNDTTDPELRGFKVDLNDGLLTLTFSETVDVATIDFTAITIIDKPINTSFSYNLTNGTIISENGPIVEVILDPDDINYLKLSTSVFTENLNTHLYLDSSTIHDLYGNPVKNINISNAKQAREVD